MEFKIDEQTLNDLELFNQALDGKSIFSCFNTACSDGGKACVRKMLERPLTDVNKIRERAEAIRYLGQLPFFLPGSVPASAYSSGRIEFYRGLPATGGCTSTQYVSFNESGGERMVKTG